MATLCGSAIFISVQTNTSAAENTEAAQIPVEAPPPLGDNATMEQTAPPAEALEQVTLELPQKSHPAIESNAPSTRISNNAIPAKVQTELVPVKVPPQPIAVIQASPRTATIEPNIDRDNSGYRIAQAAPQQTEEQSNEPIDSSPTVTDNSQTPEPIVAAQPAAASLDTGKWIETKVKSGDSLALIFSRLKLSANLLHRITHSSKEAKGLANIRPGELIRVRQNQSGDFLELIHRKSAIRSLQVLAKDDQFATKLINRDLITEVAEASGTITSSLFVDAQRAGLPEALTMELANIFGWDIDFALEIRAGDHFSLIYEEQFLDGKKFRNGNILAAEFINRGKVFRAIRYQHDDGFGSYYSPDGGSMRKAFLRAPVDFRRISSRFTKARFHPVLGKKRPHKGVDYSARTGTPIKAAGDGRVVFRGRKGGYGRAVVVQHGQRYTTLYAHMSKFRSKVKNGSRVKQGQVIGYVGQSGLATGPHLHYEFRVNGVHRNPLTVKLPAAAPIAKKYRQDFKTKSSSLLSQLDSISNTVVAEAKTGQQ